MGSGSTSPYSEMSLPNEEVRALVFARRFLSTLATHRGKSAHRETRQEAYWRIRHYPARYRLQEMLKPEFAKLLPEDDATVTGEYWMPTRTPLAALTHRRSRQAPRRRAR